MYLRTFVHPSSSPPCASISRQLRPSRNRIDLFYSNSSENMDLALQLENFNQTTNQPLTWSNPLDISWWWGTFIPNKSIKLSSRLRVYSDPQKADRPFGKDQPGNGIQNSSKRGCGESGSRNIMEIKIKTKNMFSPNPDWLGPNKRFPIFYAGAQSPDKSFQPMQNAHHTFESPTSMHKFHNLSLKK